MIRAFFGSRRWALWAYGGGALLLLSLYFQVQMTVRINVWYGGFYDMLQEVSKHTIDEFWAQLWQFMYIAMPYVLLATLTNFFTRMYGLRWREAITFNYIPRWRNVKQDIEGASQRIQEDAYRFARIIDTLGLQIARSMMTLVAFVPLLWALSDHVTLPYFTDVSGSLVWAAFLVSVGGMVISWFVGIKLPGLEYNNQKVEAAFRKELVLGEEDKVRYASEMTLISLFTGIRFNYHKLFFHYGYFDIWVNSFGQLLVVVPFVVVGPALFAGTVLLGTVMQVSNAFDKVQSSFSILIDNWTTITELRSIWKRLKEFESNLRRYEQPAMRQIA